MVDEALVLRKLAELDQYCSQLEEYGNTTVEQYSENWKIQRIIERTLQMMIETCADIAGHIIADKKKKFWIKNCMPQWKKLQNSEISLSTTMTKWTPKSSSLF